MHTPANFVQIFLILGTRAWGTRHSSVYLAYVMWVHFYCPHSTSSLVSFSVFISFKMSGSATSLPISWWPTLANTLNCAIVISAGGEGSVSWCFFWMMSVLVFGHCVLKLHFLSVLISESDYLGQKQKPVTERDLFLELSSLSNMLLCYVIFYIIHNCFVCFYFLVGWKVRGFGLRCSLEWQNKLSFAWIYKLPQNF